MGSPEATLCSGVALGPMGYCELPVTMCYTGVTQRCNQSARLSRGSEGPLELPPWRGHALESAGYPILQYRNLFLVLCKAL